MRSVAVTRGLVQALGRLSVVRKDVGRPGNRRSRSLVPRDEQRLQLVGELLVAEHAPFLIGRPHEQREQVGAVSEPRVRARGTHKLGHQVVKAAADAVEAFSHDVPAPASLQRGREQCEVRDWRGDHVEDLAEAPGQVVVA